MCVFVCPPGKTELLVSHFLYFMNLALVLTLNLTRKFCVDSMPVFCKQYKFGFILSYKNWSFIFKAFSL